MVKNSPEFSLVPQCCATAAATCKFCEMCQPITTLLQEITRADTLRGAKTPANGVWLSLFCA
jgi:hypothetical protein